MRPVTLFPADLTLGLGCLVAGADLGGAVGSWRGVAMRFVSVVLDRLTAKLRADEEVRQEVAAQLAVPRATARVVAAFPLAGQALGLGLGCLGAGVGLVVAGLAWVERLARGSEQR